MTKRVTKELQNEDTYHTDRIIYRYFFIFASIMFAAAFLFNNPAEIIKGNIVILTSPANLITDYFEISNIGAALINAAIMAIQAAIVIKKSKIQISGLMVASIFTLAGFSLFGKNIYNSTPIILGVLAYAKFKKIPFSQLIPVAFFGTALGTLVSEVTFNFGLPIYHGILLGMLAGAITGFIIPVLAQHFINFHKGFSLYNIGFTTGIVATLCTAVFRSLGYKVETVIFEEIHRMKNKITLRKNYENTPFNWSPNKRGINHHIVCLYLRSASLILLSNIRKNRI